MHVQYLIWLGHLLRLDLGKSLVTSEDVLDEILHKLPATVELAIASLLISLLIALPAGILSALRKNTFLDRGCMFVSLLGGVSIPNFWLGLLLIWLFA